MGKPWAKNRVKGLTLTVCLLWMVVIIQFSTQGWGGTQTYSLLEHLLQWGAPQLASQLASEQLAGLNYGLRKAAHLTEYAVLTTLVWAVGCLGLQQPRRWVLPIAWIGAALFAISDEMHQWFVPGRGASAMDVGIDVCGASLAICLILAGSQLGSKQRLLDSGSVDEQSSPGPH